MCCEGLSRRLRWAGYSVGRGGHGWCSEHQGRVYQCYPNGVGGRSLDMAELFMRRWPGTFQPPQITSEGLRVEQTWVRGPSLAYTSYYQTSPGPITVIRKIQVKSWNSSGRKSRRARAWRVDGAQYM